MINLDLWLWQTHLGDADGFPSDIKLIFPVTLSSRKVWRKFVKSSLHPVHSSECSLAFFRSWQIRTCTIEPITAPFEHSQPLLLVLLDLHVLPRWWIRHNVQDKLHSFAPFMLFSPTGPCWHWAVVWFRLTQMLKAPSKRSNSRRSKCACLYLVYKSL